MSAAHRVGVALAAAGLLVIVAGVALGFVGAGEGGSPADRGAGSVYSFTPDAMGPTLLTVQWSGASAYTNVTLVSGAPQVAEFRYLCQSQPGYLTSGSGSSGTLHVMATGGSTYTVYACDGSFGSTAEFDYSVAGLTPVVAVGIALAVAGGLIAWIYRAR